MTKFCPFRLATAPPPEGPAFYIDPVSGSNAYAGNDIAFPWADFTPVNSFHFDPGTQILTKRGTQNRVPLFWNSNTSTGTAGNPIVFGAYGAGARPIWSIAKDLSSSGAWSDQGANIWRATGITSDVGLLLLNSDTALGVKKFSKATCTAQGHFWYSENSGTPANGYIEMYSVGNPGSYYSHIEAAMKGSQSAGVGGYYMSGSRDYITFQDISVRYCGLHGLFYGRNTSHVTKQNMDFSFCGGAPTVVGNTYRDGNAIMIQHGVTDDVTTLCDFHDIWEVALSMQCGAFGGTPAVEDTRRVYQYGNRFWKLHKVAWECWYSSTALASTIEDVYFVNNAVYMTDESPLLDADENSDNTCTMRWATNGATLAGYPTHTIQRVGVYNNIFGKVKNANLWTKVTSQCADWTGVDIDYNWYYPEGTYLYRFFPYGSNVNFTAWKTLTGFDAHSSYGSDQLFTDPANGDLTLQSGSPCHDLGRTVTGITTSPTPDLGAYGY